MCVVWKRADNCKLTLLCWHITPYARNEFINLSMYLNLISFIDNLIPVCASEFSLSKAYLHKDAGINGLSDGVEVSFLLDSGNSFKLEYVFTNLTIWAECNTRSIFYTEFNRFEFRVFHFPRPVAIPRLKSLVCTTILPIAGGRIVWFIPFPKVIALSKMQKALSRFWTRVTMSIYF